MLLGEGHGFIDHPARAIVPGDLLGLDLVAPRHRLEPERRRGFGALIRDPERNRYPRIRQ
jgi:hypothetical protein